jgi:hypothetical protein
MIAVAPQEGFLRDGVPPDSAKALQLPDIETARIELAACNAVRTTARIALWCSNWRRRARKNAPEAGLRQDVTLPVVASNHYKGVKRAPATRPGENSWIILPPLSGAGRPTAPYRLGMGGQARPNARSWSGAATMHGAECAGRDSARAGLGRHAQHLGHHDLPQGAGGRTGRPARQGGGAALHLGLYCQ